MILSAKILISFLVAYAAAAPYEQTLSESVQFAADFYKVVRQGLPNDNIILSPLSVKTALGLLSMGANGKTATEIYDGLRLPEYTRNNPATYFKKLTERYNGQSLEIANKVFTMSGYSLKPSFNDVAKQSFNSEAESVNFSDSPAAANVINSWVKENTHGKIGELFEEDAFTDDTRLVLANAVYFKGIWNEQFHKASTTKAAFFVNEKESVQVDMMFNIFTAQAAEVDELEATIVILPYANSDLKMLLIVPNSRTGLDKVEKNMLSYDFSGVANFDEQEVILSMPKFEIESSLQLNEVLEKLGMGTMFSDSADFSNLLDSSKALKVSKAIHKAYIKVDEEGTEAAGATGTDLEDRFGGSSDRITVVADHPFFFAIVGSYDVPFVGSVRKF